MKGRQWRTGRRGILKEGKEVGLEGGKAIRGGGGARGGDRAGALRASRRAALPMTSAGQGKAKREREKGVRPPCR